MYYQCCNSDYFPVLNNTKPDKDKIIYNKALLSMQQAMFEAMENNTVNTSADYWASEDISDSSFCETVAQILNTSGSINCGDSSYNNPNFKTTDGILFWDLDGKFSTNEDKEIHVDRKLTNNEFNALSKIRDSYHEAPGLSIFLTYDGKVKTKNSAEYNYENELVKNFIKIKNN